MVTGRMTCPLWPVDGNFVPFVASHGEVCARNFGRKIKCTRQTAVVNVT